MKTKSTISSSLECTGKFILRVAFGALMLVHGMQKFNGFSEMADKFPDPLGVGSQTSLLLAIGAELGCAALLIAGLFTRAAAIPLAFTMVIALFVVHAEDPWQKKELAAVYLAAYIAVFFLGAGRFSVDNLIWGRKQLVDAEAETTD
jgi:putative oxidoreductase